MANSESTLAKAQSSFRELAEAANSLNSVSDKLGAVVVKFDAELKRLHVGIATWVIVSTSAHESSEEWEADDIGYDKINGTWGLALRTRLGVHNEERDRKEWLFNDAPRDFRIRAVDHIPELISSIAKKTAKLVDEVAAKVGQASEMLAAIKDVTAAEPPSARKRVQPPGTGLPPGAAAPPPARGTMAPPGAPPPPAGGTMAPPVFGPPPGRRK